MIPIGTDYRMARTPWANYAIVALNVGLFLFGINGYHLPKIEHLLLQPGHPRLYQFFTSMFLHANWMHIIGNMIFLWVFGNALNDRLGNLGYAAFYLGGGVLAGIGYLLLSGNAPVLGASGAIAAVTGAYLVLLPRVRVSVLLIFYFIMPIEISSLYFLLFQFGFNLWMSLAPATGVASGGVAYAAHSSGYLYGMAVALGFLATGVLPREPYDLLSIFTNWRRRQSYQRMVAGGYDPFRGYSGKLNNTAHGRRVGASVVETHPPDSPAAKRLELRRQISEMLAKNDLPAATECYLQLLQIEPQAVLAQQQQLDVANQLMSSEHYTEAANAYERLLEQYGQFEHVGDIYLLLGLLYGRYLQKPNRAGHYLQLAVERLSDRGKIDLAQSELNRLQADR